jgi:hypothetical protein
MTKASVQHIIESRRDAIAMRVKGHLSSLRKGSIKKGSVKALFKDLENG